jgi:hypothetical protein
MKSLTLYWRPGTGNSHELNAIHIQGPMSRKLAGHIRAVVNNCDFETALKIARPREGEILLNTVSLPTETLNQKS